MEAFADDVTYSSTKSEGRSGYGVGLWDFGAEAENWERVVVD